MLYLLSILSPFFCPVPSHSCDPLEDLFPSLSQYGSVSALPDDEDLDFDGSTSGFTFLIGEILCLVVNYHLLGDKLLNPLHVRLQLTLIHVAWIVLGFLGSCMKTLVPH